VVETKYTARDVFKAADHKDGIRKMVLAELQRVAVETSVAFASLEDLTEEMTDLLEGESTLKKRQLVRERLYFTIMINLPVPARVVALGTKAMVEV
jgi:hypothetical protein